VTSEQKPDVCEFVAYRVIIGVTNLRQSTKPTATKPHCDKNPLQAETTPSTVIFCHILISFVFFYFCNISNIYCYFWVFISM